MFSTIIASFKQSKIENQPVSKGRQFKTSFCSSYRLIIRSFTILSENCKYNPKSTLLAAVLRSYGQFSGNFQDCQGTHVKVDVPIGNFYYIYNFTIQWFELYQACTVTTDLATDRL